MNLVGKVSIVVVFLALWACGKEAESQSNPTPAPAYTSWLVGDAKDVEVSNLQGGFVLAGGGTDVDEAMRWLLRRANGGDVLVLRASGSNGYNDYLMKELGVTINSCETILLNSKQIAAMPEVVNKIRNAEALFIAGGDQSNYVNFWKDTPTEEAINYLINTKKAVVGGTSAGCAILGEYVFSALNETIVSEEALANPLDKRITLTNNFLQATPLNNLLTDTHYDNRNRKGRHLVFLARLQKDFSVVEPKGIGVDEETAVVVSTDGTATVLGNGKAHFIKIMLSPTVLQGNQAVEWAFSPKNTLHELGNQQTFQLNQWQPISGGVLRGFEVKNGVLRIQ